MSVIGSNILAGASGQGGGYNLTKSLRFRKSANGYLSRTMNATSTTYTVSAWVKRGLLSGYQYIFASGPNTASNDKGIAFDTSTNQIYAFNGSTQALSSAVFRDPSAWYHVVMSVNSGTATVYVNNINTGISQTSMSLGTYGRIGRFNDSSSANDFDGYMAEFNLIDGQALTPSSFGETSTTTGVWIPKKYTGTYGTNGFYLPFTNTTSTSTLGTDFSGNSNTWTVNNISLTAGSTYDSMTDVPTLTSASAGNTCVVNPLIMPTNVTLSDANLTIAKNSADGWRTIYGTFLIPITGKWYWEVTAGNDMLLAGIALSTSNLSNGTSSYGSDLITSYGYYGNNGNKAQGPSNTVFTSYGATFTNGDVIGVAFDADAGTLTFYKNNSSQGVAFSSITGSYVPYFSVYTNGVSHYPNFGQRPFSYTPPTGFVALNTFNLPTPTIGATASSQANKYFDATTYTGNGTSGRVLGNSGGFQADLVWIKGRTVAWNNQLADIIRGGGKSLQSNLSDAEVTNEQYGYVSAFSSSGFTLTTGSLGADLVNNNTSPYVAWQWKANGTGSSNTQGSITSTVSANTTAGFSIVTYTGNATSGATVGHGLSVAPSMVILKSRSLTTNWYVYHSGLTSASYQVYLNLTAAQDNAVTTAFNNTAPGATTFTLPGTGLGSNNSGATYVAYCFAPVAGYSAFGSYTGNGSTDGTFIHLGFRPKFVMFKRTDSAGDWNIRDTSRSPYNVVGEALYPNLSFAEYSGTETYVDLLSNGVKFRGNWASSNASGATYIYYAVAENPFKYANAR